MQAGSWVAMPVVLTPGNRARFVLRCRNGSPSRTIKLSQWHYPALGDRLTRSAALRPAPAGHLTAADRGRGRTIAGEPHGRHHARAAARSAPTTSTRATTGAAHCRRSASWGSISRSGSITAACTATGSARVQAGAGEIRRSARCWCSTSTTSATSPRPRSANGSATSSRRWALLTRDGEPDPVGLRLGRRAPQALHALAQAGELQGRADRPARHRRSGVRADEAPRQGDRLAAQRGRRRQDADRRRHHRAADDVRTGEGRAQDRRTASR